MPDLSNSRILIVDDVKANVDVLVQLLRDDHKLSVALGGEAALKAAEKLPPDLVLLDIVMPGMDGYEVCRRLRANPATAEVWIQSFNGGVHDSWQMMNHMGVLVREGAAGQGDVRVDVRGLSAGLYTLKMGGATATVMVQ